MTLVRKAGAALLIWLALAGGAAAQDAAAQDREAIGIADLVDGVVTVLRGEEQLRLGDGDQLFIDDRIVTSGNARLRIAFEDGSVLAVGPGTAVEISEYAAPEQGALDATLTLFLGILRATVASDAASADFNVTTQAAVASVRSTEWTVEVGRDPHTAVFVIDGTVAVSGTAGGEVILQAGEGTDVELGEPPAAPVEWGAPRVRRSLGLTEVR